ncbi:MAG: hypothetical protein IPL23_08250 [Saprospiraceae bacterium]|nr:hypothetical protein [Saprospiraceae bacterium]
MTLEVAVETEIQKIHCQVMRHITSMMFLHQEAVASLKSAEILSVNVIKPTSEMEGYDAENHDGVVLVYTNRWRKYLKMLILHQ